MHLPSNAPFPLLAEEAIDALPDAQEQNISGQTSEQLQDIFIQVQHAFMMAFPPLQEHGANVDPERRRKLEAAIHNFAEALKILPEQSEFTTNWIAYLDRYQKLIGLLLQNDLEGVRTLIDAALRSHRLE